MFSAMTPAGQRVFMDERDIHEAVEEFISAEFADEFDQMMADILWDANDELESTKQELRSYESSCEEFQNALLDARDILDEVCEYIGTAKRIDKDKIYQRLHDLSGDLNRIA